MSIVLLGSTSGSCTLQEQAVAGTTVLTLPTTSGTVLTSASPQSSFPPNIAGNGPAFSAYPNAQQTISSTSTWTKINFQTEEFDTNNNFDNATNMRFTPTVAGYYQISANFVTTSTGGTSERIAIYKNGSIFKSGTYVISYMESGHVSTLIYFNGSTDYVEAYAWVTSARTLQATDNTTWFQGVLVRAA
jgi:hypothetical protein